MSKRNPILTCLIQTLRNNFAEQIGSIRSSLKVISGVRLIDISPALGNFGLVVKLEGPLDNSLKAVEKLRSLFFIQHIATFLTPSKEIVPDKIGRSKVGEDAKAEIVDYLQRMQGSVIRAVEDLPEKVNTILVQSQRNLPSESEKIGASNVREAIRLVEGEYMFQRIDRFEDRLRALEISVEVDESLRRDTRERQTLNLQRDQVSLKGKHVAILVIALIISIVSLIIDLYMNFFAGNT